jgi:hypothetical protein
VGVLSTRHHIVFMAVDGNITFRAFLKSEKKREEKRPSSVMLKVSAQKHKKEGQNEV